MSTVKRRNPEESSRSTVQPPRPGSLGPVHAIAIQVVVYVAADPLIALKLPKSRPVTTEPPGGVGV